MVFGIGIIIILVILVILFFKFCVHTVPDSNDTTVSNTVKKELKSYTNNKRLTYYKVFYDNQDTHIMWNTLADAKFYYNHIRELPTLHYVYSGDCPYWKVKLDKCLMYVVPYTETDNHYHYNSVCKRKYIYFVSDALDRYGKPNLYESNLEQKYKNIIDTDYFEEETIMTNEIESDVQDKINQAIQNDELKELRQLINEYKDTVAISNVITNTLVKMCNGKNNSSNNILEKKN